MSEKQYSTRNRTISINEDDENVFSKHIVYSDNVTSNCINCTILGDCLQIIDKLQKNSVDLLILDPPYNLNKRFGDNVFAKKSVNEYSLWLNFVLDKLIPIVKKTGTIYICGDWYTSASIFNVASEKLIIRNRITWEREKGRGANSNWKNCSEDIWFCTISNDYIFNVDAIKLRKKVIAPYKDESGTPKDWQQTIDGKFRDTFPSNLLTDLTIPFWSMPENTVHPTQKPEKLIAKLILASSNTGNLILDPFLGSGTSSVVAKKLNRNYIGIECEKEFAIISEKRLLMAETNKIIQGYSDGIFWERNSGK